MRIQKLTPALMGLLSLVLLGNIVKAADEPPTETGNPAPSPAREPLPDPVLLVNGQPVSKALYEIYAAQRGKQGANLQSPEARQALTEELVIQELLVQAAKQQKMDQNPRFEARVEMARRSIMAQNLVEKVMAEQAPTEEAIKKEYDTSVAAMNTKEYKARHILVDSEDQAKELIGQLEEGADFAELAETHSSDSSNANGGDLGWFPSNMMVPEFSEAVGKLEKGKFTQQPVKTQFGWHVILLEDVRDAAPPSLEEVRPQIVQRLRGLVFEKYLAQLREGAEIDIK